MKLEGLNSTQAWSVETN